MLSLFYYNNSFNEIHVCNQRHMELNFMMIGLSQLSSYFYVRRIVSVIDRTHLRFLLVFL